MFDGKYHGHADELLGELRDARVFPEGLGVPLDATRHVRVVQYNDLEAVDRELGRGDVACVLAGAAVTNTGVIQPAEGFHARCAGSYPNTARCRSSTRPTPW